MKSAIIFIALIMSIAACPARSAQPANLDWQAFRSRMQAARGMLSEHFAAIDGRSKMAAALQERLDSELGGFDAANKPAWLPATTYLNYALAIADLNGALIEQLATGRAHVLNKVRGGDDVPYVSNADHTQQPLGIFVPPGYDGHTAMPLVIFLHGYTQTEADEVASPWIRAAAQASNAIVAAPYARGDAHYAPGPAQQDVYQAVAIMQRAFNIDPHRIYLAGHSMGGFGVFDIGPQHPEMWAGFLCASGAMTEQNKTLALARFSGKPAYIVEGSDDDVVPPLYVRRTARWLDASGIAVRYYEHKGGRHSLGTIAPAFEQAWADMLNGVTAKTPIPDESGP